jgi:hypothetical protein
MLARRIRIEVSIELPSQRRTMEIPSYGPRGSWTRRHFDAKGYSGELPYRDSVRVVGDSYIGPKRR